MVINFIRNCLEDFVLFSGIEGFIFCLFFSKIGGFEKFKWYEWLILSIGNCLISQIFPPLIYQMLMLVWMSFILWIISRDNFIKCLKITFISIFFMLIIEVGICFIYELSIDFDFSKSTSLNMFIKMIPIRILELLIIIFGGDKMKIWVSETDKRK